jgi:hypothetical protein
VRPRTGRRLAGSRRTHVHLPLTARSPAGGPGRGPPPIRASDRIFPPESLTDLPDDPHPRGP